MSEPLALIAAWARAPVAPLGGALAQLEPHQLATPVVHALLARAGLDANAVDALVLGNALGAGGNPARMLALASGLHTRCAAMTVDTQCCSGLDAVGVAVGLIASGQAQVVIAGGAEAWSRAPLRLRRGATPKARAQAYERPPFAPDPARDPDLLQAAYDYAVRHGVLRSAQDDYAVQSHARAQAHQLAMADEIVPVAGLAYDTYPRVISAARAARMPLAPVSAGGGDTPRNKAAALDASQDCAPSVLAVSARADGAALLLLCSAHAAQTRGLRPRMAWVAQASVGYDSTQPMLAAQHAALRVLQQQHLDCAQALFAIELHDAFAVQGLAFCHALQLAPERLNRRGGGLARGHPIGASGAIALVRVLADLERDAAPGALGLAAVAAAGGLGSAALLRRL